MVLGAPNVVSHSPTLLENLERVRAVVAATPLPRETGFVGVDVTGLDSLAQSIRQFGDVLTVDPEIAVRAAADARAAVAAAAAAAAAREAAAAAQFDLDPATARGAGLVVTSPRRADKTLTSHCFVYSRASIRGSSGVHRWSVQCVPWLAAGNPGEFWIFLGVESNPALRYEHPSGTNGSLWGISVCANGNYWTVSGPAGVAYGTGTGAQMAQNDTITVTLDTDAGTLMLANTRLGWQHTMSGLPVPGTTAWTPVFDPYDCSFVLP